MRHRDPQTTDLFVPRAASVALGYDTRVAGSGDLPNQIARLISQALRDAKDRGLSRADISRRMAEFFGHPFSVATLDKWAAESEGHRTPRLDQFVAFVTATEAYELLAFLPGLFGYAVVPAHSVEAIELLELEEQEREIAARKAVLLTKRRARR